MNYRRVCITGIQGSGGSYLAEYLLANTDLEVHGMSRWHSTTSHKNLNNIKNKITVHECDLMDYSSIFYTLKKIKPDIIFHLASYANVQSSFLTPLSVINNNVMGTANLLEVIRMLKIDPILLMCSTSEVYGLVNEKNIPINENHPLLPVNPYAVSKLTQDALSYSYYKSYDMKVIRTRMFSYINPRRDDLFATSFALQIAKIEKGIEKELKHGNLNSTRTIIDVRDAMESYWYAATKGTIGEVYNIGGNTIITVKQILEKLKELSTHNIHTILDKSLLRPIDVTLQVPDISKFKKQTGWKPNYTIDESLDYLLEYCRSFV